MKDRNKSSDTAARRMVCGFAAGLLLLPAISAKAATAEQEYSACLTVARTNPDVAGDTARAWQQRGGGAPARHCEAYALFALGRFADAAALFQSLATELSAATPGLQRDALAQAGQAWLLAGDAPRAIKAASAALAIAPDDADLLTDRAIARASAGQYWEAIDDLNRALELTPDRADILAFRASAYRHVGSLELAAEDAVRAIEINPLHVEALLELGMVRLMAGNEDAAHAAWQRLIEIDPEGPAADAARRNLENGT